MPPLPIDHAVRADVEAATRRGLPRGEIVAAFRHRASQASIYGWIARELERMAVVAATPQPPPPPPPPAHSPSPILPPDDPPDNAVAVSAPVSSAIPYLDRLQTNLARLDAMIEMAIQDGRIRNVRLALEVTKEIGVQLTRAARIQADIQDVEGQQLFLRALADVIHEEEPHIRDRIVAKMRTIGASGGVM